MPSGSSSAWAARFQTLAVVGVGDLARDAAAARRVGHQHAIAAGERQIGRQRRALVAALFLDHLHQNDLAALDDFLDLVVAAAHPALRRALRLQRLGFACVAFERLLGSGLHIGNLFGDLRLRRLDTDAVVFGGYRRRGGCRGLFVGALRLRISASATESISSSLCECMDMLMVAAALSSSS